MKELVKQQCNSKLLQEYLEEIQHAYSNTNLHKNCETRNGISGVEALKDAF